MAAWAVAASAAGEHRDSGCFTTIRMPRMVAHVIQPFVWHFRFTYATKVPHEGPGSWRDSVV